MSGAASSPRLSSRAEIGGFLNRAGGRWPAVLTQKSIAFIGPISTPKLSPYGFTRLKSLRFTS